MEETIKILPKTEDAYAVGIGICIIILQQM